METQGVAPIGHFNDDGVRQHFVAVIVEQLKSQPPSLNSNGGISLWIEVARPAENFCGNLIFLQGYARPGENVVRQIAQQFTQRLRLPQGMAMSNSIDLLQTALIVGELQWGNRHVTSQTRAA
jgi:hypothetical protein